MKKHLDLPTPKTILWTDSQCILHWLKTKKLLSVFVENRLKEIRNGNITLRFVISEDNPADLATRGISAQELSESQLWWHGPRWLRDSETSWPTWNIPEINPDTIRDVESEIRGPKVLYETSQLAAQALEPNVTLELIPDIQLDVKAEDYSSLNHLLRVTAWVLRFIKNLRGRKVKENNLITRELQAAKNVWEKRSQGEKFDAVITSIKKNKRNQLKEQLGLKLDKEGLIRCHGRMIHAELSEDAANSKLLPKDHHFTRLVIQDVHEKLYHAGVSHTLAQLRKQYWIPQGRATVKKVLRHFLICRKYEGGPFRLPAMAPWPRERVSKATPFTYTGLDYLGPLYIKEKAETSKVWICLFTCLTVHAIHLEIIQDMSAYKFLLALRRFIARRGMPKEITSDNASQFKVAASTTEKAWREIFSDPEVITYLANKGITWHAITEFAPWMGSCYERLVGLVKRSLRKSIQKLHLTYEQLLTLVTEVEAIITTRPLTYIGGDFDSGISICPADFLSLNPKTGFPELQDDMNDVEFELKMNTSSALLEAWKRGQRHLNQFWKVWRDQYLQSLRERTQVHHRKPRVHIHRTPQTGEAVLLKDNVPRGSWKLARIVELISSKDGKVRSARVMLPTKRILSLPLSLLYPLETSGTRVQNTDVNLEGDNLCRIDRHTESEHTKEESENNIFLFIGSGGLPGSN